MKHEKLKIHYTCDICGEKCEPVRNLEMVCSYNAYGDLANKIRMNISAYIPYGTADGDVCKKCVIKAFKEYVSGAQREG